MRSLTKWGKKFLHISTYFQAMDEASAFKFGDAVRKLFLSLMVLNHPSDPLKFYTDHRLIHWQCNAMIMMMMMMITGISSLKTGAEPATRLQLRTGFKSLCKIMPTYIIKVPDVAGRGAPTSLKRPVFI